MKQQKHMFNFIIDYKTDNGQYMHQAFQIFAIPSMPEITAAEYLAEQVKKQGYIPTSIVSINGNFTLAELKELADNPVLSEEYIRNSKITNMAFI